MTRRLLISTSVALLGLVALVGQASPASAHSVSGGEATNWVTTLTGVTPALPGLTLKVVENGSRLEVTNLGPEVLVPGYQGEPYLRIGPQGVFINTLSPAAYLNCSRAGCPVPATAEANIPPRWEQFSTGHTAAWNDQRIHWMGDQLPPEVARAPGQRHLQARWTVTMAQGPTVVTATGDYTWVPGPSALPWLALAALALIGVAAAVLLTRSWSALAVAALLVTALDFGHAVGRAWFWAGGSLFRVTQLFEGSSYQIPGWILGAVAVRLLWRGRPRGRPAAACAGASAVLFTGLLDLPVLSHSHAPFAGPVLADRASVALCLGLGLGVVVGALALMHADRPPVENTEEDDADEGDGGSASLSDVRLHLAGGQEYRDRVALPSQ